MGAFRIHTPTQHPHPVTSHSHAHSPTQIPMQPQSHTHTRFLVGGPELVAVHLVDEHLQVQAGVDGRGAGREFMQSLDGGGVRLILGG